MVVAFGRDAADEFRRFRGFLLKSGIQYEDDFIMLIGSVQILSDELISLRNHVDSNDLKPGNHDNKMASACSNLIALVRSGKLHSKNHDRAVMDKLLLLKEGTQTFLHPFGGKSPGTAFANRAEMIETFNRSVLAHYDDFLFDLADALNENPVVKGHELLFSKGILNIHR